MAGRSHNAAVRLSAALEETLLLMAALMEDARDPWWVIASAAVALHGVPDLQVGDVDVLASEQDLKDVLDRLGIEPRQGAPSERFASRLFATWTAAPLPVEFMAGMRLRTARGWQEVSPATREIVRLKGRGLFVPSRRELTQLLLDIGRPKDLERARRLAEAG